MSQARWFAPGSFEVENHFYTRVLNAQIHTLVRFFMGLSNEQIVDRYCHLKPRVDRSVLRALLAEEPKHLRWAGCDLMHVTTETGDRQMVVIETNSCPSGQKSMPLFDDQQEQGGYRQLVEKAFISLMQKKRLPEGQVAVIYDKNEMEATGYAASIADALGQPVLCAPFYHDDPDPPVRFDEDGLMHVRDQEATWHPVKAAMRYVTQRPWDRIPLHARTAILNPSVVCLAGGRNKAVAAKAYDLFNARHMPLGLHIRTPETVRDVSLQEVPLWVQSMGGLAVVKVPYSNAGQGVYTLTTPEELEAFMSQDHRYDRFIVQGLIGNAGWSSHTSRGRFYHVGTVPNRHGDIYVSDLRMMVCAGPDGFRPLAIYARRAKDPLTDQLSGEKPSWDMLGTNLSYKKADGSWDTETGRLVLMDSRDFNRLGLGIDELIEAYVQTVMAVLAIDHMADELFNSKGRFRMKLFQSLNDDARLLQEILL